METTEGALTPTAVIGQRVTELRERLGWSGARLARELQNAGVSWERSDITKLEHGHRKSLTIEQVLALATVLDCPLVHLLVPPWPSPLDGGLGVSRSPDDPNVPNDEAPYQVTAALSVPCWRVRQFIRGGRPLPGQNPYKFFEAMPPHEQPPDIDEWVKAEAQYRD
jgi:transcriptional regulator with XRE-family HTH domain